MLGGEGDGDGGRSSTISVGGRRTICRPAGESTMYWMKSPRVQAGVYGAIMALRRVAAIKAARREMVRSAGLERAGSRSLGALDLGHVLARRDLSLDFYPFLPLWAPAVFASPAIDEPDAAPPTEAQAKVSVRHDAQRFIAAADGQEVGAPEGVVTTSDRRVAAWRGLKANLIFLYIGIRFGLGLRRQLDRHYPHVR
jgi:hypothetical protein